METSAFLFARDPATPKAHSLMQVRTPLTFFVLFAAALLATAPVVDLLPQSWHDQQRLIQIGLVCMACGLLAFITAEAKAPIHSADTASKLLLAGILILGVASSLLAHQPQWALTELSLFIGCATLTLACLRLREEQGRLFDKIIYGCLGFVIVGILVKFCAGYVAALVSHALVVPDVLLDGFSNLRFLGQFQTLTLPLLALPMLLTTTGRKYKAIGMCLLIAWWFAAITSGTRATWLGLVTAMMVLSWLGPTARHWVKTQAVAAIAALMTYFLLLHLIPQALENPEFTANDPRLTTSLSGRGDIWLYAIGMIRAQPWLGVGPMHFAELTTLPVAHPHQAILQWASEWGIPSLILVSLLLLRPAGAVLRVAHARRESGGYDNALRLCLIASLVGAAAHSMVDGVLVMPYTQTWLAILAGWIWALQPVSANLRSQATHTHKLMGSATLFVMVLATAWLVHIAARDYRSIEASNRPGAPARPGKGSDAPRFWLLGSIAYADDKPSTKDF